MANVRPISYVETSPSAPSGVLRINYRHISWPTAQPWESLDLTASNLSPPSTIPTLIHDALGPLSSSKTRVLTIDDELDPTHPSRVVGLTELDRIVREESILVGAGKTKLDITVHEEIGEPTRLAGPPGLSSSAKGLLGKPKGWEGPEPPERRGTAESLTTLVQPKQKVKRYKGKLGCDCVMS